MFLWSLRHIGADFQRFSFMICRETQEAESESQRVTTRHQRYIYQRHSFRFLPKLQNSSYLNSRREKNVYFLRSVLQIFSHTKLEQ